MVLKIFYYQMPAYISGYINWLPFQHSIIDISILKFIVTFPRLPFLWPCLSGKLLLILCGIDCLSYMRSFPWFFQNLQPFVTNSHKTDCLHFSYFIILGFHLLLLKNYASCHQSKWGLFRASNIGNESLFLFDTHIDHAKRNAHHFHLCYIFSQFMHWSQAEFVSSSFNSKALSQALLFLTDPLFSSNEPV